MFRGRPKTRREREGGNQYLYPHETTAAIYLLLLLVLLIDCEWTSDGRAAAGSHVAAMDDRRRAREKRCVRSAVINRDYDNMRPKDNHELLKGKPKLEI